MSRCETVCELPPISTCPEASRPAPNCRPSCNRLDIIARTFCSGGAGLDKPSRYIAPFVHSGYAVVL